MAKACPNINSSAWRDLVNRFGKTIAYSMFVKAGETIPSLRQALEIARTMKLQYEPISLEERKQLGLVDKNNKAIIYKNYPKALQKAQEINMSSNLYRAKVSNSVFSPPGRTYSEVYVEKLRIPNSDKTDSNSDFMSYSVNPEEMYQLSSKSFKQPIKGLDGLLKQWASSLGFQVQNLKDITDKNGNPISAIAQVDMVRKIITVCLDKADATTLSEECAHIMVRILGTNNPLYQRLLATARQSTTYAKVLQEYKDVYKNNEIKLAEEAAGKLIAQEVVHLYENSNQYILESSKIITAIKKLFNAIKNYFKKKADLNFITAESMNLDMQPFTAVAQMMLQKNTTGIENLNNTNNEDYYYELTQEMISTQLDAENFLKNVSIYYDEANEQYMRADGQVVSRRVSDVVSRSMRRRFAITSEDKDNLKLNTATVKGTTVHAYLEALMRDRIQGINSIKGSVAKKVEAKLRTLPGLERMSDIGIRNIAYLTDTQFNNLKEAIDRTYKEILSRQAYINNQTGTKGEVRIFPEHIIYDETRDIAGTCDLVAIYSNGVIDIYDYKTHEFKEQNGSIITEIPGYTKDAWNIQLTQYKNIYTNGIKKLAEQDGRHVQVHFGATRMLPINVQFNVEEDTKEKTIFGFSKIEPWSLENTALNPVSVAEEVDLNPKLAQALEKLYQTSSAQKAKYLRTKAQNDLDAYNKTQDLIQNILVHQDFTYLFREISDTLDMINRRLTIPDSESGALTANEILEIRQRMDVYLEFFRNTGSLIDSSLNIDEKLALNNAVKNLLLIQELLTSKPVDMLLNATGEDITKPGNHVGWLAGWFSKLSEFNHPIFRAFSKLLKSAQAKVYDSLNAAYDKIQAAHNVLLTYAKEHNTTVQDLFNKIINTSTGTLINKYNASFYQDLANARTIKLRSVQFFLDNYEVIRGPKGSGFRYTGKALEDFNKATADWQRRIKNAEGTTNEEREKRRYDAWRKHNDLAFNKDALYSKYNRFIKEKYRVDNPAYYSDEFKAIQEIKPLVDYYNMYVKFNVQFEEITGRNISTKFIANVRNDLMDSIFKNGISALGDIRSIALSALETRDESDILYKSKDETSGRDYAGNPIKHIPVFYIDPLKDNLTKAEIQQIEASIDPKLVEGSDEWKFSRNNALRKLAEEKGLRHKSYDLSRVLLLMAQSVYTYQHMKEIEANAQLLLYFAKSNDAKVFVDDNLPNMDKWNGKIQSALGLSSDDIAVLEKFIDLYVYGKTIQETGKPFTFMGKTYSWGKLTKELVRWSSLSTLGFKPILGIRAFIQNMLNFKMVQSEGLYFDKTSVKKADKLKKENPLKYNSIQEFFHISNKDYWKIKGDELSANRINRILNAENAYYLLDASDTYIDRQALAAILYAWGYNETSHQIVRMTKNPNAIPIADLIQLDENTGTITVDKLTSDDIIRFRSIAQDAATAIKGVMPAEDRYLANTTIAGTLVMQYRGWLPGLLKARAKALQKNPITEMYDIGRFRVGYMELAGGAKAFTEAFTKLLVRSLPIIGYLAGDKLSINEKAARKQYEDYFKEHPQESKLDFTFEDFCQLRLQKLKALGYELQSMIGLFLAAMIAKALVPDDPDDDLAGWATKIATQNLYRTLYGAYLEASFFIDFKSATDIVSSPFASLTYILNLQRFFNNTIDETRDLIAGKDYKGTLWWEEDKYDRTPAFYFTSRLLPGVNAAQDFFDIFDTFTFNQR